MSREEGVSDFLKELLRCPVCAAELEYPEPQRIHCPSCGADYPVKDGIPDLVPPELDSEEDAENH